MERLQVFIVCSKGKKDRYEMRRPILQDVLTRYKALYKRGPQEYVFEGQEAEQFTKRSNQIPPRDKGNLNLKNITFHALSDNFATHLQEKEGDSKYIRKLLGHFDIKTAERPLHLVPEKLVFMESPLDDLDTSI